MKKIMSIILVILLIFICLFVYYFGNGILLSMPWNKEKAANVAKEYLAETYQQEMQYIKVDYPPINIFGKGYTVYFSPVDNPDMIFMVVVGSSFDLPVKRNVPNDPESYFSPDNYLLTLFEYKINKLLQKFANEIWDANVKVASSVNDGSNSYKTPNVLSEKMSVEEMEVYLNYDVIVTVDKLLDDSSKTKEAKKILEMIESIKRSNTPKRILFWYETGKSERGKRTTDVTTWPRFYVEFKDWSDITTIDQVLNEIDNQWIAKYSD